MALLSWLGGRVFHTQMTVLRNSACCITTVHALLRSGVSSLAFHDPGTRWTSRSSTAVWSTGLVLLFGVFYLNYVIWGAIMLSR